MADDKLHPEVEALIEAGPQFVDGNTVTLSDGRKLVSRRPETEAEFARRIANFAASKASEEEQERCAKVCEAEKVDAAATSDSGDHAYNLAIDHCAAAIRLGKP